MSDELSDRDRVRLADESLDAIELVTALLAQREAGGTVLDRMREARDEGLSAQRFDTSRVSGSSHSDPTTSRRLEPDGITAEFSALDEALRTMRKRAEVVKRTLLAHMPRDAAEYERRMTQLEEANRDPGCESCARITNTAGYQSWSPSNKTGTRADRLNVSLRLCRWCGDRIDAAVNKDAKLPLAKALPRAVVREYLEGRQQREREKGKGAA